MMESDIPIDWDHPAVKDYLSLIRLQVLTPLSLLINMATVIVCTIIVNPGIPGVTKSYPTSISPRPALIAIYVIAIYAGQIGYCVLLVLARKAETKRTLTKGVGLSLVLANWVMAGWAIAWVMQAFLTSTILLGVLIVLLLYANMNLLVYHAPTGARPFDIALIHAPLRFFLILPASLLFPYSLFITLGLSYDPAHAGTQYDGHAMAGFDVVLGTNLLGLLVIVLRRDIVWAVAATWISISVFSARPKPAPVYITEILFTVLHPLALVCSLIWVWLRRRGSGRIALRGEEGQRVEVPAEADSDGAVSGANGGHANRGVNGKADGNRGRGEEGPREVDVDGVWG
ncbi:hypothetical protein FIBSPDRAFT_777025 [Athelia psychrophila]|uniref:Uncharacterized protein n=1 Tax=Athelia psychrophila TaxID=1759441 RepID=A0A166TN24_9AGAM|nr:hypothetical protein FIBSPDRAFT_777025 [Fibularhizoctonia sp. CBS 109695]